MIDMFAAIPIYNEGLFSVPAVEAGRMHSSTFARHGKGLSTEQPNRHGSTVDTPAQACQPVMLVAAQTY